MIENIFFARWVRKAVLEIGGIDPYICSGSPRKWSLTYAESEATHCQVGNEDYFSETDSMFAMLSQLATTNQDQKTPTLH